MPSKSKAQHNLMAMVANDPKAAKRLGISQSVGRDFVKADKGRKFGFGGSMKESKSMMRREVAFMKKKGAPKSMVRHEEEEMGGKMKKGVRKFQGGGYMPGGYRTPQEAQRAMGREPPLRTEAQNKMGLKNIAARQEALTWQAGEEARQKALQKSMEAGKFSTSVKNLAKSTLGKGGAGALIGSLATAYGPQIVERFSALAGRKKPTVTVEEVPQGKAHGGKIESRKASKGSFRHAADGMAHKGKTKGRVVKMAGGGMAYSSGGSVYRKGADGIASKGKTKGRMVKMAYGGKC
jgi:hypothetical protein